MKIMKLRHWILFLLVFLSILSWRLYATQFDCCPNNNAGGTLHSCSKKPAEQCGSGNTCWVCKCDIYYQTTITPVCANTIATAGVHSGFRGTPEVLSWCTNAYPTDLVCRAACVNNEFGYDQTPTPYDNYCSISSGDPNVCGFYDCYGMCWYDHS